MSKTITSHQRLRDFCASLSRIAERRDWKTLLDKNRRGTDQGTQKHLPVNIVGNKED